ncbi:MAG TPA: OB-fold domain-containing protein [Gemmatales bacterium]|nr:OB-fold domain-containing protein [Gemmatales bacterium]HMP57998.1 OB-fold domain-containing protein [Gemmatales bacterium]
MITRLTGTLNQVLPDRVRLQVGPMEYELLVPENLRQRLEGQLGTEVTLHTRYYLEGGAMQSAIHPRLIGFTSEAEIEFFDLFCTVDKIGTRKALKAFARPVRDIAVAIMDEDQRFLSKLPGLGPATAEKVVSTLRKKVAKFALMRGPEEPAAAPTVSLKEVWVKEALRSLAEVGYTPAEARDLIDAVQRGGKQFESSEELLLAVFQLQHQPKG